MPTSSTDNFLPRGSLIQVTSSVDDSGEGGPPERDSGWYKATGHSSVVGYFSADNGIAEQSPDADLTIVQSIEKDINKIDISNQVNPDPIGNAQPFEFDLVGNWVRAFLSTNEDLVEVRLIAYRSTRVDAIQAQAL